MINEGPHWNRRRAVMLGINFLLESNKMVNRLSAYTLLDKEDK